MRGLALIRTTKRALLCCATALGIMYGTAPQASAADSIIIGGPQFAPLYMDNPDGEGTGTMVRLLREIAEEAGYTDISAKVRPARRSQIELESGVSEISILVIQETFTPDKFWRSEEPVTNLTLNLYAMGEAPAISSLDEVRDTDLIVMDGYSYGGWRQKLLEAERGVSFVPAGTQSAAVQQLVRRRAPLALLYGANVSEARLELGEEFPTMKHTTVLKVPMYLYVSLKAAEAEEKVQRLSAALAKRAASAAN